MTQHDDPIADALRERIRADGVRVSEIADRIGVNRSALSLYLHRRRRLRCDVVARVLRDRGVLEDVIRAIRR